MNRIKWLDLKYSIYLFLLPLFFLLHGLNENFGLIPVKTVCNLALLHMGISVGVFLFSLLLFRQITKATLFAFFVLSFFFFFGAFHDFLKSIIRGSAQSYTFLLPLIISLTLVVFIFIKKTKAVSPRLVFFLNILFFFFIVWELAFAGYYWISGRNNLNTLSQDAIPLTTNAITAQEKPDIFFIVLDGYTSSQCLNEAFNFKNSEIDSLLSQNHFFTSYLSSSNYNITPFSLSSTLSANYLKFETGATLVSNKVFSQAVKTFSENHLMKFLKQQGYELKNFGCFNHELKPTTTKPYFDGWEFDLINNQTLYSRIKRDIGWNFVLNNNLPKVNFLIADYKKNKEYHIYRNKANWDSLTNEIQAAGKLPRFVYAHLMIPHEPFFVDEKGKEIEDSILWRGLTKPSEGYLKQVEYVNGLMKNFIPLCATDSKRSRVVIIEGDHGYRFYASNKTDPKVFKNLNTYYFSDHDYSSLYNGISPVNSFRVVLNKYFDQHLPLLKDSSIYLREPGE